MSGELPRPGVRSEGWKRAVEVARRFVDAGVDVSRALSETAKAAQFDSEFESELRRRFLGAAGARNGCGPRRGGPPAERRASGGRPADPEAEPEDSSEEIGVEPVPDVEPDGELVGDRAGAVAAARRVLDLDRRRAAAGKRVLTALEEVGLSLLIREGLPADTALDPKYAATLDRSDEPYLAFEAMVRHNQGLVHGAAQKYTGHGLDREDLEQHGQLGLIRAVEKFNLTLGYKFSTYATWWIRQALTRAVADEGSLIRIPVHMTEKIARVARAERSRLAAGLPAEDMDLAVACGLKLAEVRKCRQLGRRSIDHLDRQINGNTTLADLLDVPCTLGPGSQEDMERIVERMWLKELLAELPSRQREVLLFRSGFVDGEPWTLDVIGQAYGLSRERIRQLEGKALTFIREQLGLEAGDGEKKPAGSRLRVTNARKRGAGAAGMAATHASDPRSSEPEVASAVPGSPCEGRAQREDCVAGEERLIELAHSSNMGSGYRAQDESTGTMWGDAVVVGRARGTGETPVGDADAAVVGGSPAGGFVEQTFDDSEDRQAPAAAGASGAAGTSFPAHWYHRPAHADGGREYGNPAAFAFDADLAVLAREAVQNSLDERLDPARPVRVRFTLHELTGEHLETFLAELHWEELAEHYAAATSSDHKVGRVLAEGLQEMTATRTLRLLCVDDYNAHGLTGPEYGDGRFAAVVRRQLDSLKSSGRAGGSYGLGKATLWAASRLGLVLINSTLSEPHEGRTERRLVGRLDLPWHSVGEKAFAGPAWLGVPDTQSGFEGVSRSWWADERTVSALGLERSGADPGTSFLIVGVHDGAGDAVTLNDMHEKIISALSDNFWAAMVGGRNTGALLEASVATMRDGAVLIPEQRVDPCERHPALVRALRAHVNSETVDELTAADQVASIDVPLSVPPKRNASGGWAKEVEHRAVLLVTPAHDADRQHSRVVCMRGSRMTVMTRRPRELGTGVDPFQAVLLAGCATGEDSAEAEAAEAFLRASEPPEHDAWGKTEELTTAYKRGSLRRLADFRAATDIALRSLVGRRSEPRNGGPEVLRELIRLDQPVAAAARSSDGHPTIRSLRGTVDEGGAWTVTAVLRVPRRDDSWLLNPVAKFEVRSGGRPTLAWAQLTAVENCRVEGGRLRIDAGVRSASFTGVTEPSSHPVAASMAAVVVDLVNSRGGSA
ncbi:sigma-70 family RNA polymerase sigma factor [Streptomyces bugieae]|uniref:Sigma-70 family RNA polymerase sigma factor n=1 Tax=Streptomyces bugieae TaxID=3098223 RepID=A0ABU7P044_9ACTN|nr:sigma-70 family RNA polymerase sigma factor [Streptomyces sp. DSM 41528]